MRYTYDDGPGKIVTETQTVIIDPKRKTYTTQSPGDKSAQIFTAYGFAAFARKTGRLFLFGKGDENGKSVQVQNTITHTEDTLDILHETRLPQDIFRLRSRYRFRKAVQVPATSPKTQP